MTFPKNKNRCGRGRLVICSLMVLAVSVFALSCGKDETTGAASNVPQGELMSTTVCKELQTAKTTDTIPSNKDGIEYYYSGRTLFIKHVNAGFNCCTDISGDITVAGGIITIDENEGGMSCHCLCLFDLEFAIRNLQPGQYMITVNELYLEDGDEKLEFNVNLNSSPTGSYWVERNHYPWGQ